MRTSRLVFLLFSLVVVSCTQSKRLQKSQPSPAVPANKNTTSEAPPGHLMKPAAERTRQYFNKIEGKRIGIVANQTSLIGKVHLVDSLLSAGMQVVKVFSPEHGFRGQAEAGETVGNNTDAKTGLPLISLYGDHRKPTPEDLTGIDLMLFDLQDVGTRFYTYISTLTLVMQAAIADT
jgi:uncharacterized protein YbbC (DUF1343 family)